MAREVFEESGIRVRNVRYVASQPWPFPHSLMMGFTADYESGEIRVQDDELVAAAFFAADRLPRLPPHGTIARRLIRVVTGWRGVTALIFSPTFLHFFLKTGRSGLRPFTSLQPITHLPRFGQSA